MLDHLEDDLLSQHTLFSTLTQQFFQENLLAAYILHSFIFLQQ